MTLIKYAVSAYMVIVMTWIYYLAAMKLIRLRHELHPVAKVHGWVFVIIPGVAYDIFLNFVMATIIFFDPPREVLLTQRLKRYKKGPEGWRKTTALWICEHLLDQFDTGGHC